MDRSIRLRRRLVAMVALALVLAVPGVASAGGDSGGSGSGKTTRTTIHIPLTVLDNLCNGAEPVALSGDLMIVTRTTPDARGGYTVQSSSDAHNLQGQGLVSMYGYEGDDGEDSYAHYAPPPYPSTQSVVHYTRLVPKGPAPSEYLVVVLRETVLADGTVVPTLDRTYLTCRPPKR
jgi:hypothetical protein